MTKKRIDRSKLIIFSDFDGTISTCDVGNRLFDHFSDGKSQEPVSRWKKDLIGSKQCLIEEAALMRDFTEAEFFEYIDSFEIDPEFGSFKRFCREADLPLYLLSDGLDIYIDRLMADNGHSGLPVFANNAVIRNNRLEMSWPYLEHSCGRCANCKGYQIRRLRRPGQKAVYIGDGKSDLCALPEADQIFAKGFLAEYCRKNRIEFLPFDDFSTITKRVKDILS